MRVGVIGSGLAGLAAACTLAARGHEVEVFEKNEKAGRQASAAYRQGLSLRHGADDSDSAVGAAQDLRRDRAQARGLHSDGAARPAVALLFSRMEAASI